MRCDLKDEQGNQVTDIKTNEWSTEQYKTMDNIVKPSFVPRMIHGDLHVERRLRDCN